MAAEEPPTARSEVVVGEPLEQQSYNPNIPLESQRQRSCFDNLPDMKYNYFGCRRKLKKGPRSVGRPKGSRGSMASYFRRHNEDYESRVKYVINENKNIHVNPRTEYLSERLGKANNKTLKEMFPEDKTKPRIKYTKTGKIKLYTPSDFLYDKTRRWLVQQIPTGPARPATPENPPTPANQQFSERSHSINSENIPSEMFDLLDTDQMLEHFENETKN